MIRKTIIIKPNQNPMKHVTKLVTQIEAMRVKISLIKKGSTPLCSPKIAINVIIQLPTGLHILKCRQSLMQLESSNS